MEALPDVCSLLCSPQFSQQVLQRPLGAERCKQATVAVRAQSPHQALPLNSESATIIFHPGHFNKLCSPFPTLRGAEDQPASTAASPHPSSAGAEPPTLGARSLTRCRHPRSRPQRAALRNCCTLSSRTRDPGPASPRCRDRKESAGAAPPCPLPRRHACVRPGDIGVNKRTTPNSSPSDAAGTRPEWLRKSEEGRSTAPELNWGRGGSPLVDGASAS